MQPGMPAEMVFRTGDRSLTLTVDGGETCTAALSLVRLKRRKLTKAKVVAVAGDKLRPHTSSADRVDYRIPANGRVVITWD